MIRRPIQKKNITLVNTYAPSREAPKYKKQILIDIKGKISANTVI